MSSDVEAAPSSSPPPLPPPRQWWLLGQTLGGCGRGNVVAAENRTDGCFGCCWVGWASRVRVRILNGGWGNAWKDRMSYLIRKQREIITNPRMDHINGLTVDKS